MNTSTIVKHAAVIGGLITLVWILFIGGDSWLLQLQGGKEFRDKLFGVTIALVALLITYELTASRESDQF
ncbi:MAG: hypothetical protein V4649_01805 [Bacteroidota bacterium]